MFIHVMSTTAARDDPQDMGGVTSFGTAPP